MYLSNSLEADWPELSHMTTPAVSEARLRHFYSGWQWTQLKIRALLLRRKDNRCRSRQPAPCQNMHSPFQLNHLGGLLVGGLKPHYSKCVVHGPATPASCGNALEIQTQRTPDLLN